MHPYVDTVFKRKPLKTQWRLWEGKYYHPFPKAAPFFNTRVPAPAAFRRVSGK